MKINLRPTARQFPFDETCSELVSLLEQRNFSIPGIEIKFSEYGHNYKMVSTVEGNDFRLWFCRVQNRLGKWNDIAGVSELIIGDISLSVYEDGSGPTLFIYVGDDIDADKGKWSWDLNAKLLNRPRRSIMYKGSCEPDGSRFRSHQNEYLVQSDDLGRAYSPKKLKEGQLPHHSHKWSIDKSPPMFDVPDCVMASDVFRWVDEELKKRLTILRES